MEEYTKIFITASENDSKMSRGIINVGSADAEDEEDDEEEEGEMSKEEKKAKKKRRLYMHPAEVQEQMKFLWANECGLLERVWGTKRGASVLEKKSSRHSFALPLKIKRIPGKDGYRVFFMNAIAVPPNRFRPPQVIGGRMFEHAQNVNFSKLLKLNARLEGTIKPTDDAAAGSAKPLAAAIRLWTELQETTNLLIDSTRSKSANALKDAPHGVRQLLEKKEGLFRQNMMGTRVNFAARSVISPDVNSGTDEVGVPVRLQ